MLPKLLVVIAQNSLREQKGTYPWLFVTDGRGRLAEKTDD